MDNIDMLINELESELLKAKKSAFTNGAVIVDKNRMLDLVSRLRTNLPAVIREATAIKRDRDSIMQQADEYAKKSLDDAGFDRLPPWRDALARFLSDIDIAAL